jgi:hypothetical protein
MTHMSMPKRRSRRDLITPAFFGLLAGASLYAFVRGHWDAQGWFTCEFTALLFMFGQMRFGGAG